MCNRYILKNGVCLVLTLLSMVVLIVYIPALIEIFHKDTEKRMEKSAVNALNGRLLSEVVRRITADVKKELKQQIHNELALLETPTKPAVEPDTIVILPFMGEISQGNWCLDTLGYRLGSSLGMHECHGKKQNQFWHISEDTGVLQNRRLCVQGPRNLRTTDIVATLQKCTGARSQAWEYTRKRLIRLNATNLCLENIKEKIYVQKCNSRNNVFQKWDLREQ